jgi:hypothetical protein
MDIRICSSAIRGYVDGVGILRRLFGVLRTDRNHPRVIALRRVKAATERHERDVARMRIAVQRIVEAGNRVHDEMFLWKGRVGLAQRLGEPELETLASEQLEHAMARLEHLTEQVNLNQSELEAMERDQHQMSCEFYEIKDQMIAEGFAVDSIDLSEPVSAEAAERSVDDLMADFEVEESLRPEAQQHREMAHKLFASVESKQLH